MRMTAIIIAIIIALHHGEQPPEPAQVLCCSRDAGCSALPESGFCPDGKTPHECSDTLTCDPTGEACWYECKPSDGGVS